MVVGGAYQDLRVIMVGNVGDLQDGAGGSLDEGYRVDEQEEPLQTWPTPWLQ